MAQTEKGDRSSTQESNEAQPEQTMRIPILQAPASCPVPPPLQWQISTPQTAIRHHALYNLHRYLLDLSASSYSQSLLIPSLLDSIPLHEAPFDRCLELDRHPQAVAVLFVISLVAETDIVDLVTSQHSICGCVYLDGEVLAASYWFVNTDFSRHSALLVSRSPLPGLIGDAAVTIVVVRFVQGRVIGIDF